MRQLFKFDTVVFHNFDIRRFLRNPEFQRSFQKFLAGGKRIIVVGGEQVVGHRDYQELFLSGTSSQNCSWNSGITKNGISGTGTAPVEDLQRQPAFAGDLKEEFGQSSDLLLRTPYRKGRVDWVLEPQSWTWKLDPSKKGPNLKPGRTGKGSGTGMRHFGRPCCSSQFGNGKGFSVIFLLAAPTMNRKRSRLDSSADTFIQCRIQTGGTIQFGNPF